jgi:RNA polymerase subunit RPABC4/transcription elongation factor Spt4
MGSKDNPKESKEEKKAKTKAEKIAEKAFAKKLKSTKLREREKKKKKDKVDEKDERVQKIVKRLQSEDVITERVRVEARLVSSPDKTGVNVKIKAQILDPSFYAKACTLYYNAGTEKFEHIIMEKIDQDNFAVVLANIPTEIQIIYYIMILDKSGASQQFPRPELIQTDGTSEEEPYFSFMVEPDGTIAFKKEWDDGGLVDCRVCGYACQRHWDVCPECKSPLYDTFQEVLLDDQKAKLEARKKLKEDYEDSWDDSSDEAWRSLPECPNCGYTVQMEWSECPVCHFDLSSVELEKKASYEEFMSEEDKEEAAELSDIKKRKKKIKDINDKEEEEEPSWEDEEGVDIL